MIQATINCGYKDTSRPDWLIPMAKDKLPQPAKEMFPKKAKFQVSAKFWFGGEDSDIWVFAGARAG